MTDRNSAFKQRGVEFWNANPCGSSATWPKAQSLRFRHTDPYLLPILEGALLERRRVLEVGCGQGLDAERIVQRCHSYTGIDLSTNSIRSAQKEVDARKPLGVATTFHVADAENLPFDDRSFDVVYSIGVLHHTPDFERALIEVHRVLEPGGRLILMLYRSFNPLWVVLRTVRGILRMPVVGEMLRQRVIESERERLGGENAMGGTAMLELFGCPIIDTYTLTGLRRRFDGRFRIEEYAFHRVGLEQVIRVLPPSARKRWPQKASERIERLLGRWLGFYMVVIAERI